MVTDRRRIAVDGATYEVEVSRKVVAPPEAPRLVMVSYEPNAAARGVAEACIRSVQAFTPEPHELWVVDNASPPDQVAWLAAWPGINVVFNRTTPRPPEARGLWARLTGKVDQRLWGSYANALALELAVRLVDPETRYLMPMHMDTMAARAGWLTFLRSKVDGKVAAAGVRMDRNRVAEGVLHVLGYMVDFQRFRAMDLDFLPDLPALDVGDRVTVALRAAGHEIFACRNTLWEPALIEQLIPDGSPFRTVRCDRSFDDDGNVIFLHLGRGVRKASGEVKKGTSAEEWVAFGHRHLSGDGHA